MKTGLLDENTYFSYGFERNSKTGLESSFDGLTTFIYIKSGTLSVKFFNGQQPITVSSGEMLFLPIMQKRSFSFNDDKMVVGRVFCFRYWPSVDELDYSAQKVNINESVKEYFLSIPPMGSSPNINSNYIWKVYRFLAEVQPLMRHNDSKKIQRIQNVLEYMKESDCYTIPELVKISGMSKSRFYEAFLMTTGLSPIKMKHRLQAYKGELLLKSTELSIEEITKKLGFVSAAHFRKVFRSRYGVSPLKFRKGVRNNDEK